MSKHTCPSCEGVPPSQVLAFINTGEDISKHRQEIITVQCRVCNGAGRVTDAVLRRFNMGRDQRTARIAGGVSLKEAADALGVKPSELSAYEHGYADLPNGMSEDAAPQQQSDAILKKFKELPLGTKFRYKGLKDVFVVLERHGFGKVAKYEPHDGAVAGQGIYSAASTESECEALIVEVVP